MKERPIPKPDVPERKKIGEFELQPTDLPGIFLQVEKGAEVEISELDIRRLQEFAHAFAETEFGIRDLRGRRGESRPELIQIAKSHEGLRGLVSEFEGFRVTITRKVKREWDPEVLQEALGILYTAFVSEDYEVSINIPQGAKTATGELINREKISEAIRQALSSMGLNEEDISAILGECVSPRVDTRALQKAIEEGRASIPPEASTEDITWEVKALPLQKGT